MAYAPVPDYVLASTERILGELLPLLARPAAAVTDAAEFARYRQRLETLAEDTRAAARSDTLAEDLAALIDGYRAAVDDPRAVIDGLERLVTAARGVVYVTATCATEEIQRRNEEALALLFETLAIAAQGAALADLVPRSSDEANRYRLRFGRSCRLAIERAGDGGQMPVARALRELGGAIARDMIERGRPLARIVGYETAVRLPAVTLAHLLYQDAGRRDELAAENETDHPGFMPRAGTAYSR